jgi:hypothetical protein
LILTRSPNSVVGTVNRLRTTIEKSWSHSRPK